MRAERWSKAEARAFLTRYHFAPTDVPAVFARLGSVQYDPLDPVGRNVDLVLQARVPGYRVDEWQVAAYRDRLVYDAWDKQACLVPTADWAYRRIYHEWHRPRWEERVLGPHADAVAATLAELRERGPLATHAFADQRSLPEFASSWHGPKVVRQALRALWHTGGVATHHRDRGRHVYHLPEAVIPAEHLAAPAPERRENLRWLILARHRAAGLLRPGAPAALWSMPVPREERVRLIEELVEDGRLLPVDVEGRRYHLPATALAAAAEPAGRMRFLGPLDSLLWDRQAVRHLFDFDYLWEVYKPEAARTWGYYVLPVLHRGRFVARFDSRRVGETWRVYRWWWEEGATRDEDTLAALAEAARRFAQYLGAERVVVDEADPATREALTGATG